MIDLVRMVRKFNNSSHHISAFNELQRHIPEELLRVDADWVTIYNEADTELNEPKKCTSRQTPPQGRRSCL